MPAWEDISPYTEQRTRAHRFSWTNLLIILNLTGFVITGFLTKNNPDALAFLEFDKAGAIAKFQLWEFVTFSFVQVIDPKFIVWLILGIYTLYTLGNELEAEIGSGKYLVLYFSCAAYGAAAHAVLQYVVPIFLPDFRVLRAASLCAPVLGIAQVAALRWPRRPVLFLFFLPLRLRTALIVLGLAWIAYAMVWFPQGLGPSAGALALAMAAHALEPRIDRSFERASLRRERDRFLEEIDVRRRTDGILDKITREGMASLTWRERRTLRLASQIVRRGKGRPHE